MMFRGISVLAVAAVALTMCGTAEAASFTADSLVVMRCTNGTAAEKIYLDEYDISGATPSLLQSIELPSTGPDAVTMPGLMDHDRHLHRSVDGRYLTFAGYNKAYGSADPKLDTAAATPRVVGVVKYDGSYDLSTKLTDTCDNSALRGAVTTNGTKIWVGGDNTNGTSTSGGTRFTTRGSSTSVNLSRVQSTGGTPQPDNIRDVNIFAGQLYNSSGSGSSVGKALFQVGTGLPESGSQTLTKLTTDNQSITSFVILDADPAVPGLDTVYAAAGTVLRKYNLIGSTWTAKGTVTAGGELEQITARLDASGNAVVYGGRSDSILRIIDASPYGGTVSGAMIACIAAPGGYTLGGLDFAPVPEPASLMLLGLGGAMLMARRRRG